MSTHRASAPRQRLDARIEAELGRACHPAASVLADAIRARHGDTVAAVLFYGSCLRQPADQPAPPEGILDFYVIVDRSANAYDRRWLALAGRLLPPNVFYLERPFAGSTIRAKYAVVTMAQFLHGTSARCFHPSLWARFAQPVALLYARDDAAGRKVAGAVSAAVITMTNPKTCVPAHVPPARTRGSRARVPDRPDNGTRGSRLGRDPNRARCHESLGGYGPEPRTVEDGDGSVCAPSRTSAGCTTTTPARPDGRTPERIPSREVSSLQGSRRRARSRRRPAEPAPLPAAARTRNVGLRLDNPGCGRVFGRDRCLRTAPAMLPRNAPSQAVELQLPLTCALQSPPQSQGIALADQDSRA
jgi:hypothetical protein